MYTVGDVMRRTIFLFLITLLQLSADNYFKDFPKNSITDDIQSPRQERFVNSLVPVIIQENEKILKDRKIVSDFFLKYDSDVLEKKISRLDYEHIIEISFKYKITDPFAKKEFDEKIDAIPVSLALSQAILESGWGESRIAKKANNIFGQKSFSGGKQILASNGEAKYSAFEGYIEAVRSYMLNLNSHEAYTEFRKKRAVAKFDNKIYSGLSAAKTLKNYSEIGRQYTSMLSELIRDKFRGLDSMTYKYSKNYFDARFLQSIARM